MIATKSPRFEQRYTNFKRWADRDDVKAEARNELTRYGGKRIGYFERLGSDPVYLQMQRDLDEDLRWMFFSADTPNFLQFVRAVAYQMDVLEHRRRQEAMIQELVSRTPGRHSEKRALLWHLRTLDTRGAFDYASISERIVDGALVDFDLSRPGPKPRGVGPYSRWLIGADLNLRKYFGNKEVMGAFELCLC